MLLRVVNYPLVAECSGEWASLRDCDAVRMETPMQRGINAPLSCGTGESSDNVRYQKLTEAVKRNNSERSRGRRSMIRRRG
jgi:hypothetical protein